MQFVRSITVLIMILMSGGVQAQEHWPFEFWHEGKIVLVEGDTLKGMVKYDLQQDLVQYSLKDSKPEVFTARKVMFFEIFDETIHRYRRFFSLPYAATSPGYKSMIFFELLEEGKMTLLTREFLEYKNQNSMYVTYARLVMSYKYFFLKENGEIEEFKGSKSDLLDLMGKKSEDVEKFIRKNRLRHEDKDDLTRIIDFYNSLFQS
jgi:hypothetical protein